MMSTVLVTGANRGLGLGFAGAYADLGWQVIACCRHPSPALLALDERHQALRVESLDVSDRAAIDALAARLDGTAIDVLLNNAGTYGRLGFAEGGVADQAFGNTNYENWEQVLRVNLFGPMKMAEAFLQHVERSKQKKIVTLSSMMGSMGLNNSGGMYAYRTSKAAVNMMMHSMGIDLASRGIIAVAMHPGWARTDMGGPGAEIDPSEAVSGVMDVIAKLSVEHVGQLTAYDGSVLPY
jgi:NAD(P)-dependent dehydrogenase (short-subunit alcohol dehydrogenase family)